MPYATTLINDLLSSFVGRLKDAIGSAFVIPPSLLTKDLKYVTNFWLDKITAKI